MRAEAPRQPPKSASNVRSFPCWIFVRDGVGEEMGIIFFSHNWFSHSFTGTVSTDGECGHGSRSSSFNWRWRPLRCACAPACRTRWLRGYARRWFRCKCRPAVRPDRSLCPTWPSWRRRRPPGAPAGRCPAIVEKQVTNHSVAIGYDEDKTQNQPKRFQNYNRKWTTRIKIFQRKLMQMREI